MSRYLVTGAAGFIGSHLTESLLARGDEVVAVDSFTDYYDPSLKEENAQAFDVERLDVADEALPLEGVDGVFHLAAQPGVRTSFDQLDVYLRRNVLATQRVLEQSAVRVVYASSSSVYGDAETYPTPETARPSPISPYGVTKLACEQLAHALRGRRDRPALLHGVRTAAAPRHGVRATRRRRRSRAASSTCTAMRRARSRTSPTRWPRRSRRWSAARTGAIYNVGGGEEATMREAIGLLERVSGRRLDVRAEPPARGDAKRTAADVSVIARELGWSPTTRLEDGLAAQWSWAVDRVAAR